MNPNKAGVQPILFCYIDVLPGLVGTPAHSDAETLILPGIPREEMLVLCFSVLPACLILGQDPPPDEDWKEQVEASPCAEEDPIKKLGD